MLILSSKLKAMEKMNLNDECLEGKIETRKISIDKNIFPKSKYSKNKRGRISAKKSISTNKHSRKKSKNKGNDKNIIINVKGKIEKSSMKSIDLINGIDFCINKEKELNQLFSNKSLLTSIINEMKNK